MPAKPKQKDNVSKNMGARYSTLEPWNLRTKPHTLVIDVKGNQTSSSPTPRPMEWSPAAKPSTSMSPTAPTAPPANSTDSSGK